MQTTAAHQIAIRHFGPRTVAALAKKGVLITGTTAIPGKGPMPWANASTAYVVNDMGTQRVLTAESVRALVQQPK